MGLPEPVRETGDERMTNFENGRNTPILRGVFRGFRFRQMLAACDG